MGSLISDRDIETEVDIEFIVHEFYKEVRLNKLLATYFEGLDWDHHMPRMILFWNSMILDSNVFKGNPMAVHQKLHKDIPLVKEAFDLWPGLFENTIDSNFSGEKADQMKVRARSIAQVIQLKTIYQ